MEQARGLSDRILKEASSYDEARIRYGVQCALARNPTEYESERLLEFVKNQRTQFENDPAAADLAASKTRPESADEATSATWTAFARVMLNLDEFITRE